MRELALMVNLLTCVRSRTDSAEFLSQHKLTISYDMDVFLCAHFLMCDEHKQVQIIFIVDFLLLIFVVKC